MLSWQILAILLKRSGLEQVLEYPFWRDPIRLPFFQQRDELVRRQRRDLVTLRILDRLWRKMTAHDEPVLGAALVAMSHDSGGIDVSNPVGRPAALRLDDGLRWIGDFDVRIASALDPSRLASQAGECVRDQTLELLVRPC